ncbi:substrate-binding periplasmic protein [Thalassotalea insulae]|uniref:substrate-binding periplasmic protein n=1 Tax=Thalassotalea insulae TaxID=2056778 RepID=UPI0024E0E429|nr:transporter substrate-binding domain-containing protein [Thalassotalea insulae]
MLIIILFFSSTCLATDTIELTIVTEYSPPYQELSSQGVVTGFTTEVIKAVLAQTPFHYQINIYPWSRSFMMAKEQPNTCIYSMARNPQREQYFQWVAPIVTTVDYFIGLSERSDINIQTMADAKNYNVAVLKDDRTYEMLINQGFIKNKNLYVINNTYSMLKLLLIRKDIDLVLADSINIEYRAKYHDIDPSKFRSYYRLNQQPINLYLACSLNTPKEIVKKLTSAMQLIMRNGSYQIIHKRWHKN